MTCFHAKVTKDFCGEIEMFCRESTLFLLYDNMIIVQSHVTTCHNTWTCSQGFALKVLSGLPLLLALSEISHVVKGGAESRKDGDLTSFDSV